MKYERIGGIGNYYGYLMVMEHGGKYYWLIENWDTDFENINHWDEIDKEFFDSLIDYQRRFKEAGGKTLQVLAEDFAREYREKNNILKTDDEK